MPQLRSAHMPTTATPLPVRKRPGNRASGNQSGGDLEGGSHIHSPDLSIADQAAGASPSGMDPNDNTHSPDLSIADQAAGASPSGMDPNDNTHSPDLSIADQAAGASPSGVGPNDNTHAPDLSIADQEARTKDPEDVSQSQTNNSATGTSPAGFESTNDAQSINSMLVEPNCEASPQDAVEWDQNTARGRYEWLKAELARTKVKQAELSFEKEVLSREFGINSDVIIVWSNTHNDPIELSDDGDSDVIIVWSNTHNDPIELSDDSDSDQGDDSPIDLTNDEDDDDSPIDLTNDDDDDDDSLIDLTNNDDSQREWVAGRNIMRAVKRSFDEYMQNKRVSVADALRFAEELKDRVHTQRGKMMKVSGMGK